MKNSEQNTCPDFKFVIKFEFFYLKNHSWTILFSNYVLWRVLAYCAISSEDGLNCGGINWGWSGIIRLFLLSELQQPNNIHFGIGIKSYQKALKCTSKTQLSSHSFWKRKHSWLLLTKMEKAYENNNRASPQSRSLWSMAYACRQGQSFHWA